MLKAINPNNQSLVDKALRYNKRYDELNNLRNEADDNDNKKSYRKYDKMCVDVFDKYLDAYGSLPKNQQQAIDKFIQQ